MGENNSYFIVFIFTCFWLLEGISQNCNNGKQRSKKIGEEGGWMEESITRSDTYKCSQAVLSLSYEENTFQTEIPPLKLKSHHCCCER